MSTALSPASPRGRPATPSAPRSSTCWWSAAGWSACGTALDAVTRGLSTGLVEQRDFASGTSSRSSKLIHGGLRYLEMLDFGLVREALEERGLLLTRLAPHLVRPVPFLYPLTHRGWERPYVGAGLALYDAMAMAGKYDIGRAPAQAPDPARRAAARARPARRRPGRRDPLLRRAGRRRPAHDDAGPDRRGARRARRVAAPRWSASCARASGSPASAVVDLETGREFDVRARVVVNAAGVWTNDIQELVGGRGALKVQASKGIHLVVPRDRIRSETGLILRTEKSVLFVIPWGRHWIIGTTDTPWDLDKAHPAASRSDIDYLLGHVNAVLKEPLRHEDVEGVYAGLRPLASGESEPTSRISREHTVVAPVPGLVMIAGGKYTTYRVMARDAVDAAVHSLGGGACRRSVTDVVRLAGADGFETRTNQRLPRWRATRACTGRGSTTCSAGTAASSTRSSPWSPTVPSWRGRCPAPRTTCGPRWSTRSATRAPGTSTTC